MKKSEATRKRIIEEAAILFNRKGIAGTTIDDVLQATGLAKGCLYNHFESKELLAYEAVDFLLHRLTARKDALAGEGTAAQRLTALIGLYSDPLQLHTPGGCPVLNFGSETDDTNPGIRDLVKAAILRSQERLIQVMESGKASGELSADLDVHAFALKIFAMIEGGILMSRTLQDNGPMNQIQSILKTELSSYLIS